jgi:hypothetical protein
MKADIANIAGILFVLALAIVLPFVANADLERHGFKVNLARPAIIA